MLICPLIGGYSQAGNRSLLQHGRDIKYTDLMVDNTIFKSHLGYRAQRKQNVPQNFYYLQFFKKDRIILLYFKNKLTHR